jgi:hypothetical protein
MGIARRALIGFIALGFVAAPAATQRSASLSVLSRLEPGLWVLRDRDGSRSLPSICLRDDRELVMQVRHGQTACTRLVIASDAKGATVHYTCPGAGFGRTSVRVETPRLLKLDSQGVHEGVPFAFRAEARRISACPTRPTSAVR